MNLKIPLDDFLFWTFKNYCRITINTKLFDCIVDSSQVGIRKPDERIYKLTARKLGMQTNSCVMIDDLEHNIKGAEQAGMAGILFSSAEETEYAIKRFFDL